jgi:hypothetical protein
VREPFVEGRTFVRRQVIALARPCDCVSEPADAEREIELAGVPDAPSFYSN